MQNETGLFGGAARSAPPQTYDEMLAEPFIDDAERKSMTAEATLGGAAAIMVQRGDLGIAKLFLDVVKVVIEWDPESQTEDLWLEVAPENRGKFTDEVIEKIREACQEISRRRGYRVDWASVEKFSPR